MMPKVIRVIGHGQNRKICSWTIITFILFSCSAFTSFTFLRGWLHEPVNQDEFHPGFTWSEPVREARVCFGAKPRFGAKTVARCPFVGSVMEKKTRPYQPGSRSAELARTGPVVMLTSVHTNLDKLTGSINTLYSLTATLVGKNLIINKERLKKEVVHAQLDTIDDDALTNISIILAEKQSISTMLRSTKNVCS